MNSNECKLKIKVCYKDKYFEDESEDIIPLQKIKEKAIEKLNIIKEDEEFINFQYHSNKENKNESIKIEDDIIRYSDEDSSGNLFCNLELVINNPKRKSNDNKLANEIKVKKIESKKTSNENLNKINEKVNADIKEEMKKKYEDEINKLKSEIENINNKYNSTLTILQKENSEKEKVINNLNKNIENQKNEIINKNSKISNLSSELENAKKESVNANNQKTNIMNKYRDFNDDLNKFIEKTDDSCKDLLNVNSTLKGIIEKMELNKKIVNGYAKEMEEEKKKMKENEKNKNIELIKSVIRRNK